MLSPITRGIVTDKNMKYQTGNTASKNEAYTCFFKTTELASSWGSVAFLGFNSLNHFDFCYPSPQFMVHHTV